MGLRSWLGFYTTTKFAGNWPFRLKGLFDCGVDFRGKSVLDVGCNMGIIAYEISKHEPSFIHGIDNYSAAIRIARAIFDAVPVKSRFDVVDLINDAGLRSCLTPTYDVMLFLAVYHKIREVNPRAAAQMVATLAGRCRESIVARVLPEELDEFSGHLRSQGFELASRPAEGNESPMLHFRRVRPLP